MRCHAFGRFFLVMIIILSTNPAFEAIAAPIKIVALGDSLTAGFGLPREDGFTIRLQAALVAKGYDVEIVNAGVSGDTTSGGRARLEWSLGADAQAVFLELGANDMLRGIKPDLIRANLDTILSSLKARNIPVLIAGMQAAPNLGTEYGTAFNAIYPDLAQKYDTLLYPFFLDGVAGNQALNQPDGIHPSAEGVQVIVERILPSVEELINQVQK